MTKLMIYHYHYDCFHEVVKHQYQAVISHGFVSRGDNVTTQISKCRTRLAKGGAIPSIHKLLRYNNFLLNHTKARQDYYALSTKTNLFNDTLIATHLSVMGGVFSHWK